ncbi:FAS1 domain-containing protein, partial [Basidiobolus meristosporus CBS 931.73]
NRLFSSALLIYSTFSLITVESTTTVIDVISADAQFTELIRNLQKTRLIPLINSLPNCMLLAPTNEAFAKRGSLAEPWELMYHIVNGTTFLAKDFYPGQIIESVLSFNDTLGEGEGQRFKVSSATETESVSFGEVKITVPDLMATRGVVHAVDGFMTPPKNLESVIDPMAEYTKFKELLGIASMYDKLKEAHPLTMFLPDNKEFERFNELEMKYLTGSAGRDDLSSILSRHIHPGLVYTSDIPLGETELATLDGQNLTVTFTSDNTLKIDGSTVIKRDTLASNGVIHHLENMMTPPEFEFNAKKYLLALNYTNFVAMLTDEGFEELITDNKTPRTILAPPDHVLNFDAFNLPPKGSQRLKDMLKYHVTQGKYAIKDLYNGQLLATEMTSDLLRGASQQIQVKKEGEDASFNDIRISGEPVEIGNSIIYPISFILPMPKDILELADSNKELSAYLSAVHSSKLDSLVKGSKAVTLFVPSDAAFAHMGIVSEFLMLSESTSALQTVLRYHMIKDIVYSRDISEGVTQFDTFSSKPLNVSRTGEKISVVGEVLLGSQDRAEASVVAKDVLTTTGVVHVVDRIQIPSTLDISLQSLILGSKASVFLRALEHVGFKDILTGSQSYTILIPTDQAFSNINMTELYRSPEALKQLVQLHIIPDQVEHLKDSVSYETLLENTHVVIHKVNGDRFAVLVEGARYYDDQAQIINTGTGRNGRAFVIDRVLLPSDKNSGATGWKWLAAGITILSLVLLCGVGYLGFRWYKRRQSGYEPIN